MAQFPRTFPRRFYLYRKEDLTGISGTGVVAHGIEFLDGKVVLSWLTATSSLNVYSSVTDVEAIHGHGDRSFVVFID